MDELLKQAVQEAVQKRKFLKIQYRTHLNEYLSVTALIKHLHEREDRLVLELATGEEIPFEQLVKVGEVASQSFNARDFTCDC